jgi:hypothetical protein
LVRIPWRRIGLLRRGLDATVVLMMVLTKLLIDDQLEYLLLFHLECLELSQLLTARLAIIIFNQMTVVSFISVCIRWVICDSFSALRTVAKLLRSQLS